MKWTFGIVTAGGNESRINKIISSIETQAGITSESYDIVVVGACNVKRDNTRVIPFDETIKKGWITLKKNMIAAHAMYENIVIVHDYLEFRPGWYEGYEKFGGDWDVSEMRQTRRDGVRFLDWFQWTPRMKLLSYDDHSHTNDGSMFIPGNCFAVKTKFFLENPLDVNLVWGQAEDCEWSSRIKDFVKFRMNPWSEVRLLKENRFDLVEDGKLNVDQDGNWLWK